MDRSGLSWCILVEIGRDGGSPNTVIWKGIRMGEVFPQRIVGPWMS